MDSVDHRSIGLLGLVTICAYGSWYYAFGVLLDPIRTDTGWSEASLAASFSAGTVIIGLAALGGGRLLDRAGPRVVFAMGGVLGATGLLAASFASSIGVFFVASAVGLGSFGALGFYPITMATAVRLNPDHPKKAIAELTIWGAWASAIFLPLTGWLVDVLAWRETVRLLAVVSGTVMLSAAALLPSSTVEAAPSTSRLPLRDVLRGAVSPGGPRSFTVAIALGGIAMSTLLVYQVPVMTSVGLSAATAATMAGVRGFAQMGGRLPLSPIVAKLGSDRALILAFSAVAVGGGLLAVSDRVIIAAAFAVVAGFGIGAFSPLQGMKAEELFDHSDLGATMGFYGSVMLLAGSIGPVVAGVTSEWSGDRRLVCTIVVLAAVGAALAIQSSSRRSTHPPA